MTGVFKIASQIGTPLGLAGFIAAVFLFLGLAIIKRRVRAKGTGPTSSEQLLGRLVTFAFVLALIATCGGVLGYWINHRPVPTLSYTGTVRHALNASLAIKDAQVLLEGITGVNPELTDSSGTFDFDLPPEHQGKQALVRVTHDGFDEWTGRRRFSPSLGPDTVLLPPRATAVPTPAPTQVPTIAPTTAPIPTAIAESKAKNKMVAAKAARLERMEETKALAAAAKKEALTVSEPVAVVGRPTPAVASLTLPSAAALPHPSPPREGWAYYGEFESDRWTHRYFKRLTGTPEELPTKGDRVEALTPVNVRTGVIEFHLLKGWQNQKLIGFISPGTQSTVSDVERIAGHHIWIKYTRGD